MTDPTPGFTRRPTGRPLPPVILVNGIAHGGKSTLSYRISASKKVHRTFVFEVGERDADQYAALGPYEIVELNGTWSDFITKLAWVIAQPHPDGVPNVIIIDTISRLWDDLKDWAAMRARNSVAAREKLRRDPDAYIDVSSNYWNDAKERWGKMLNLVNGFDGITILIARGDEVTAFENGQPVRGESVWSIDAEKRTVFNVTANVSIRKPHQPRLMSTKTLGVDIPSDGIPLAESDAMEDLIFNILNTTVVDTSAVRAVGAAPGVPSAQAKGEIKAVFLAHNFGEDDARDATLALWKAEVGSGVGEVAKETVERLVALADERLRNPAPEPPATDPAGTGQEADTGDETAPTGESEPVDPKAQAEAFVRSIGGDPDAPQAPLDDVDEYNYDDDPEDEDAEATETAAVGG